MEIVHNPNSMKKTFKITGLLFILILSLFFYFKWNELKYILRFGNSKSQIVEKNINIGKISLGESTIVQFKIANIGNNDLKVEKTMSNCQCAVLKFKDSIVKENDTLIVNVLYKPSEKGKFDQEVALLLNTAPPFHFLHITGEVIE